MSEGLKRYQRSGDLHFFTFNCFRKRQILGSALARDRLLGILEEARVKYDFEVHGYVVMPGHVHLLLSEPASCLLALPLQVIKQRFSRGCVEEEVWEVRYYDFNVRTWHKRVEKLRYIHRNPVARELVEKPEDWEWSSYNFYATGVPGRVVVTTGLS